MGLPSSSTEMTSEGFALFTSENRTPIFPVFGASGVMFAEKSPPPAVWIPDVLLPAALSPSPLSFPPAKTSIETDENIIVSAKSIENNEFTRFFVLGFILFSPFLVPVKLEI